MPSPRHQVADLQILRAIAIIFVMLQHAWFNLVFDVPGFVWLMQKAPLWCGVDLFFVISGYLITGGLLARFASAAPARRVLLWFWLRRATRLWPAAWCWLALILLGSLVLTDPPIFAGFAINLRSAMAGVLGYANIQFATHPFQIYGPSYPYWSLSLEEQFYALLPLLMLVSGRFLPFVAAAAIIVQFPLAHGRLYMFTRTDALLWGVLLACWARHPGYAAWRPALIDRVPGAGLAVMVVCLAVMVSVCKPLDTAGPGVIGVIAAAAALLIWLASHDRDTFFMGPLQRPLLWVGDRSYVLYLAHVPVFQCAADISHHIGGPDRLFGDHIDLRSVAIGLPLLAAAAELTHRCVERPLRRAGAGWADRVNTRN